MVGKIKEVIIETDSQFSDYYPYLRTIGQTLEITKVGIGEVIACELTANSVLTTIKINSVKDRFWNNVDVYPSSDVR